MSWGIQEDYYSGQGVVLVGVRGADGKPQGLRPVGNVPDLKIAIETSNLEHKEATTGARGTDLRLTTELKCNLNFTLENFSAKNLADALRGDTSDVAAGSVVDYPVVGYPGMVTAFNHVDTSAISLKQGATTLVPYVDDVTPWDYITNPSSGSLKLNDGALLEFSALGLAITAVTVGTTTSLAIANSGAIAGGKIRPRGLTGADAADLNGKEFTVVSATSSAVVIAADTTGKTITATGTPKATFSGMALLLSYTYGKQVLVDALSSGARELYMRFEGLNTVQENKPVVVEVFRFLTDPLKELALISDTVQQFVLEGSALADTTRMTGSKYFNVRKLS